MQNQPSSFAAEILWAKVPPKTQKAILENVWCGQCKTAVRIIDYTLSESRGDVLLAGRCATCAGIVRRLVETSELSKDH